MPAEVSVTKIDVDSSIFKSTTVEKLVDLDIDVGTLLAIDINDLDLNKLRNQRDNYLKDLARDNTQLLINAIWELPTKRVDEAIVAELPPPSYTLPREKPIPQPKPLTRWQQYMKDKGLKTTKKSNLSWDDILKKWVPRYGFKKAQAEREKNWVIEVPQNADPYEDQFEKLEKQKQEKVSKNEFQRLRNIAKAKNIKVPSMGLPPTEKLSSLQLNSAALIANSSTASLGKFQPRMAKEKQLNANKSVLVKKRNKRPMKTSVDEHKGYMDIADNILNKRPAIDMEKAINRELHAQESQVSEEKKNRKGGGGKRGKGQGKPKSGKKKSLGGKNTSFKGDKKHKNFAGKGASGRKRR